MMASNEHPKPRILFLVPWFDLGGADKFNLDLVSRLSQQGYQFYICATLSSAHRWYSLFAPHAAEIVLLAEQYEINQQPEVILDVIETRQIDLVFISHSYLGYLLLPLLRSHFPHLTYVDYTHIEERDPNYRGALLYQDLLDLNIVSSQHLKNFLVEQGSDGRRIEVCYTNIDPIEWNPAAFDQAGLRAARGIPANLPIILYAGRLVQQKRPRTFIEVIQRLVQVEKLNFICLVAGEGEAQPFLEAFVQQRQLQPYVHFLGAVPLEQMKALQAMADIFFLPSEHEGISLAIFEAMAMQTVPVSADVGGQRELVTPECGYLIAQDEDEVEHYVAALKQLIQRPEQRRAMAQAGRERIMRHFNLDDMIKRMVALWQQARHLAQTSPRPPVSPGLGQACRHLVVAYNRLEIMARGQHHYIAELHARQDKLYRQLGLDWLRDIDRPSLKKTVAKIIPAQYRLWLKMQRQALTVRRLLAQVSSRPPLAKPAQLASLSVLMVYAEMGAPTRYRIAHQATQLERLNLKPLLYSVDEAQAVIALAQADLLYFYRVEATPITDPLVALARQQRIPIIFDTDDLIWDPRIETFCYLRQHWPGQEVDDFLKSVERHARIMAEVDAFVTSNPYLAQLLQTDFGKPTYVHQNCVSDELIRLSHGPYQAKMAQKLTATPVTLGYFSGWMRAHQEDFETILEPLRQILAECPHIQLKIVGYLEVNCLFPGYEDRLQLHEFVSWEKLPELLSQIDINLAPLVDNPHRRCKSAVKFMEAALVGVPTIASNLEPYQDIQPGQTGFLASTPSEWYDCLRRLIDSPDLRLKMGAAARRQVLSQDTLHVRAPQFKEIIRQIVEDYYG